MVMFFMFYVYFNFNFGDYIMKKMFLILLGLMVPVFNCAGGQGLMPHRSAEDYFAAPKAGDFPRYEQRILNLVSQVDRGEKVDDLELGKLNKALNEEVSNQTHRWYPAKNLVGQGANILPNIVATVYRNGKETNMGIGQLAADSMYRDCEQGKKRYVPTVDSFIGNVLVGSIVGAAAAYKFDPEGYRRYMLYGIASLGAVHFIANAVNKSDILKNRDVIFTRFAQLNPNLMFGLSNRDISNMSKFIEKKRAEKEVVDRDSFFSSNIAALFNPASSKGCVVARVELDEKPLCEGEQVTQTAEYIKTKRVDEHRVILQNQTTPTLLVCKNGVVLNKFTQVKVEEEGEKEKEEEEQEEEGERTGLLQVK